MVQDLIQRLRQVLHTFNPPCNETQMQYLKVVLQAQPWPDYRAPENPVFSDLMLLFRDHNGMPISSDQSSFPRMLSFEEALAFNGSVAYLIKDDKYLFWDAGDSNFYGIYLREPLMGRVFYLNHDDIDFSPVFQSVRSMYEALLLQAERWRDGGANPVQRDYPKTARDLDHDLGQG